MDLPRPFGPYTLLRRLAVGGMAEVYVARARGIGGFEKLVAIKVIHPRFSEDEHFIQMLVEEAKISVLLTHVNIAQIFDLGCIDETYFIVMEYIEGADAYRMLRRAGDQKKRVPLDICAYIAAEVCNGLDYAHRKRDSEGRPLGIVHRDISPQNVLLSYAGEVKLVDFGIAKAALRTGQTEAGVIKGKYYYMSPEQAWGDPMDHRSDIFSTGVVLYELLTGEMLYQEDNIPQLLDKVRKAEIAPPSTKRREVPRELDEIVLRAVAKRPQDRYQSAHEMAQALSNYLYRNAPQFTSQRVADAMAGLFEEELRKYGSSLARTSGERRLPSDPPPSALGEDEPTVSLAVMAPDEFAPDPTKSIIFDLEDEEDETRNDVLPYRRRLELERQREERDREAARRRASVRPPAMSAGTSGGVTRPLRSVPSGEPPTVVVDDPRASEWDDTTMADQLSGVGSDWEDESTMIDSTGGLIAEATALAESPPPSLRARANERPAPPRAPPAPRPAAWPEAPPAPSWPVAASPAARPPVPPPRARPVSWPPPSPADSEPPTDQFHGQALAPQSYPAVSPEVDPFAPRPPDLETAGWAAIQGAKRSYVKWIIAVLAVVVLAGIGVAGGAMFAPEPPPPVLEVISVPPGARVNLDGADVPGTAPVRITNGLGVDRTHRLEVALDGYETWTTTFQPTHGLVKQIAVLTPQRATLTVETDPPGAHVWIDGVLYGSAPVEVPSLAIGREVEVRASKPGHAEAREKVRIDASDLSPTLRLTLPRS